MSGITTTTRSIARDDPDPAVIDEAVAVLRRGGLVAFPTETVYGLGADATNPEAVARIYAAKGRPGNNPLIVHGQDVDSLRPAVCRWTDAAERLAGRFWPGPLTLVLPRSRVIPDAVTAGQETVGIRVPDSVVAGELLRRFGGLIAAPSANRSTGVSPTRAGHVLKDLDGLIDLILDAGPTPVGIESTVVDLTADVPTLLRPGAITAGQIGAALGIDVLPGAGLAGRGARLSSPGQMEVHYSPRARTRLVDPDDLGNGPWPASVRCGLLVAGRDLPDGLGSPEVRVDWSDPATAARELYATLHRWDEEGVELILVVLPPDVDAWRTVRDRLWRASRQWSRGESSMSEGPPPGPRP